MAHDKSDLLSALRIDRTAPEVRETPRPRGVAAGALATVALVVCAIVAVASWSAVRPRGELVRVTQAVALPNAGTPLSGAPLLDATGYVVARRQTTVGPKIAGKLTAVLVEEGMRVEAGQVIARLDDSNAQAAVAQARATLAQAQTAEADARPLFERSRIQLTEGLISSDAHDRALQTYNQAQTAVGVSRAVLAVAAQNNADTVVRAPFAGVVTAKAAQVGEIISPLSAGAGFTRTGVATIVDMNSLEVVVDVSENFINRVSTAQPCTITLNAYPDWRIPGHVIAIVPTANRAKATVSVRVSIDAKDARALPEMGARVTFLGEGEAKPAPNAGGVVIPSRAVAGGEGHTAVFVVKDGRAERRAVKLGSSTAAGQIVQAGLSGGEIVVLSGLEKLKDGSQVRIEK